MKLINLQKTVTLCIQYHEKQGNKTKADQLKNKLQEIKEKKLEDEQTISLY